MTIDIRPIDEVDVTAWVASMSTGFLRPAADDEAEYRRADMDLSRTLGAFDGHRVVGTLRSFPTTLTVPGPDTAAVAGLTNVTVSPTHRRRGLLTEMITRDLQGSADRGEMLSILIASEFPIYGRFGYGAAVDGASYNVDAAVASFRQPGSGTVELVDLASLRKEAPLVYNRYRAGQVGAVDRSESWWDRALHQVRVPGAEAPSGFQAVYRSATGAIEGYLRYHASPDWDQMRPDATLHVDELVAITPDAYHRLWQYCCEVDLVTTVRAGGRPVDEPLVWLLHDGRVVRQEGRYDFVWVRIIDVPAALSARRYDSGGRVVIEVVDPMGLASGRFALDGNPDGASCSKTDAAADLSLPVDVLGSVFLGGVALRSLDWAGRVIEHRAGSLARADRMFRSPQLPWCSTWF